MRVILGDNPFFDINHKTGGCDRGFQQQIMKDVVTEFMIQRGGIFLLSDHLDFRAQIIEILAALRRDNFSLALISPVPHTINDAVANGGYKALIPMVNLMSVPFLGFALIAKLSNCPKIYRYFLSKSIKSFIRKQTQPYLRSGIAVSHFGMHNVFVDMLLASKNIDVLNAFVKAVRALKMTPILLTQNVAPLLALEDLEACVICGSINPNGYMMSPSQSATELAISMLPRKHEIWAMQVLAGGTSDLKTALEYLGSIKINSFVYATSKQSRVTELFKAI